MYPPLATPSDGLPMPFPDMYSTPNGGIDRFFYSLRAAIFVGNQRYHRLVQSLLDLSSSLMAHNNTSRTTDAAASSSSSPSIFSVRVLVEMIISYSYRPLSRLPDSMDAPNLTSWTDSSPATVPPLLNDVHQGPNGSVPWYAGSYASLGGVPPAMSPMPPLPPPPLSGNMSSSNSDTLYRAYSGSSGAPSLVPPLSSLKHSPYLRNLPNLAP
jgi:hypothetical protein